MCPLWRENIYLVFQRTRVKYYDVITHAFKRAVRVFRRYDGPRNIIVVVVKTAAETLNIRSTPIFENRPVRRISRPHTRYAFIGLNGLLCSAVVRCYSVHCPRSLRFIQIRNRVFAFRVCLEKLRDAAYTLINSRGPPVYIRDDERTITFFRNFFTSHCVNVIFPYCRLSRRDPERIAPSSVPFPENSRIIRNRSCTGRPWRNETARSLVQRPAFVLFCFVFRLWHSSFTLPLSRFTVFERHFTAWPYN